MTEKRKINLSLNFHVLEGEGEVNVKALQKTKVIAKKSIVHRSRSPSEGNSEVA
jgi:hypothetical protein